MDPSTPKKGRADGQPAWKQSLYDLFEEPNSSPAAYYLAVTIVALIVVSICAFVIQTLECRTPPYRPCGSERIILEQPVWDAIETLCTLVFTVEYVARISSCEIGGITKLQFMRSSLNVLDILAIVPFYVEIILDMMDVTPGEGLKILCVARVLRLFKLARYSISLKLVGLCMARAFTPVSILIGVLNMCALVFSSIVYYVELAWNPEGASPFESIPNCFYWAITTMTTVGYGDIAPNSPFGKFIACLTMFCGILLLALPVIVVGGHFKDVHAEFEMKRNATLAGGSKTNTVETLLNDADKAARIVNQTKMCTEYTCTASMDTARTLVKLLRKIVDEDERRDHDELQSSGLGMS